MKHFFYHFYSYTVKPKAPEIILLLFIIFSGLNINAQKFNIEPGITAGTSYYLGDINHTKQFYSPGLTAGLALRHNINNFYALRLNIIRAEISGNDADFESIYQNIRNTVFSNTVYETSLQIEINFLSFNTNIKKSQTPYITTGAGIAFANSFETITPVIPIGIGYKYSVSKRITVNGEWNFRKTFTDYLDLLEQTDIYQKQITKTKNNDWYSIASVTLTYNFAGDKKWCPAYSKHKKH
ncbi:MAG: hypothetical protein GXO50_02635 [Chlorobi bacterium]|nr:hypothetical protein [Chlorobiota bacterium]